MIYLALLAPLVAFALLTVMSVVERRAEMPADEQPDGSATAPGERDTDLPRPAREDL